MNLSLKSQVAFIFARGGSKGIKNKNIQYVGGKPLIAHSIKQGLASKYINKIIVSTDSKKIADISKSYGADILMRPKKYATDTADETLAWKHAIRNTPEMNKNNSMFISIPATSPLRKSIDINNAIDRYVQTTSDIIFGITPSHRSPYLNMVTIDNKDLIKITIEGTKAIRRQDTPKTFDITTCVYVSNTKYILNSRRLMDGKVGYVMIPNERSLDIDTKFDLKLANLILSEKKLKNKNLE